MKQFSVKLLSAFVCVSFLFSGCPAKGTANVAGKLDENAVLNAGKDPDIAIFFPNTGLDVIHMAKNGSFEPLNKYIESSENPINYDNYINSAFDAGKVSQAQFGCIGIAI